MVQLVANNIGRRARDLLEEEFAESLITKRPLDSIRFAELLILTETNSSPLPIEDLISFIIPSERLKITKNDARAAIRRLIEKRQVDLI
jgi:hypothetical protein